MPYIEVNLSQLAVMRQFILCSLALTRVYIGAVCAVQLRPNLGLGECTVCWEEQQQHSQLGDVSGLLRMGGKTFDDYAYLVKRGTGRRRGQVSQVSVRLGQKSAACPAWMLPTDKSLLPKQPHIEFPKPPKGPGWFLSSHTHGGWCQH